ncbi:hypothetical protein F2P79_023880 [Pimephales promelas]|nr:hypothetical protein F2P79_023880 [Pimephales promelas]
MDHATDMARHAGDEMSDNKTMNSSSGCTVNDVTDDVTEEKTKVQSGHLGHLQKLRAHHNACEERYMKAHTKTVNDEQEKTMFLYQSMKTKLKRKMPEYETEESSSEFKRVLMDSDGSDSENETGNGAIPSDSADKSMESTNEVEQHNQQPSKGKDKELQPIGKALDKPHTTKVSSQNPRRKWSKEEIQAVEKTLMDYIHSGKVPGKAQCMECIERSQAALQGRRWEAVKFYVKNRIDALKRKM